MTRLTRFSACLLTSGFLAGCADSTESHGPPASLIAVGQTSVAVTAGASPTDSLAVKVVDAKGRAVPNADVAWSVTTTGSTVILTPAAAVTNKSGIARAAVSPGTRAGSTTVRASTMVEGTAQSVSFEVVVSAGPAATLQAPQSVVLGIGATRTIPLSAADQYGNVTNPTGVVWTTSDANVAEVNGSGAISPRGLGAATITARIGQATANVRVSVVPAVIMACERNTATLCSNWTLNDTRYNAVWSQGSQAVIDVVRFDADSVVFSREDPAGTSTGMRAVYRGVPQNRAVQNGVVTWTQNGFSFSGTWYANW